MGLFDDPLANCEPGNQWRGCPNCARLESSNADMLAALEIIAGERQCVDDLMSDKDIARAAIEAEKARSK